MDSYFTRYLVLTGVRSCIFLPEAYVQQYVIYVLVCIEFTADSVQLSLQMDQQQQWMYNRQGMYISGIETYTAVVVRARTRACLVYLVRITNINSSGIIPTSRYSYLLRVLHPPCAVPAFVFSYRSRSTHGQLKSKLCLKLFKQLHRYRT